MDTQNFETIAKNLLEFCIIPNCESHNVEPKELLNYMLTMNYQKLDEESDTLTIKKKRGPPRGSKNSKVN